MAGVILGKSCAVLAVIVACAAFAGNALAQPPVLVSAGVTSTGHPTASWTLPDNVTAQVVEVATAPDSDEDGSFHNANLTQMAALDPADTTWTGIDALPPGTYYLHVGGTDSSCINDPVSPCKKVQYTSPVQVVVSTAPTDPTPPTTTSPPTTTDPTTTDPPPTTTTDPPPSTNPGPTSTTTDPPTSDPPKTPTSQSTSVFVFPTAIGLAAGTITGLPTSATCAVGGGACFVSVVTGTTLVLNATAGSGSVFKGWTSGPCSGSSSATCTFVTAGTSVTVFAQFSVTGSIVSSSTPGLVLSGGGTGGSGSGGSGSGGSSSSSGGGASAASTVARKLGKAQLQVARSAKGGAKLTFVSSQARIFARLTWQRLPTPSTTPYTVVWYLPNGAHQHSVTYAKAKTGMAMTSSIARSAFATKLGRWHVRLLIGKVTVASAAFTIAPAPVRTPSAVSAPSDASTPPADPRPAPA